jgi:integrase
MAAIKMAAIQGRYAEAFRPDPQDFTFADLAEKYLDLVRGETYFDHKRQVIEDVLLPTFGERRLKSITFMDLELFRGERENTPTRRGTKRSVGRINREMAVLRHMFNKALAWDWLEVNPFKKGKLFPLEKNSRTRYLTYEEAERLLAECPDYLRPIVETAINTGMRRGEIFQLQWDWIRGPWLHLPPEATKSGEGRSVSLNEAQLQVFKDLRAKSGLSSKYVFPSLVSGRPYNTVYKSFEAACRRAGIVDFRFHDLRHTCGSWMVMAGVSLKAVQQQLGHKTLAMAMRYAHLAPGHQQEAINKIGTRQSLKEKREWEQNGNISKNEG